MDCKLMMHRKGFHELSRWACMGLLAASLSASLLARAAEAEAVPPPSPPTVTEAPVIVDGVDLFDVSGIHAFPAKDRARGIQVRIEAFAENPALSSRALTVTETADGSRIALGEHFIMVVSDLDAQMEDVNRPLLARLYVKRISEAIETYRRDRTNEYLLRSAGQVLIATLALLLFIWLGKRAVRRIDRELDGRVKDQLAGLEHRSLRLISASHLWSA
ncbi:MAG: hypothetical protein Q7U75_10910 [Desulfobacterales bacterium]|nr:hypothetical protein [Desulfobacterales bacterium]